MTSNLLRAIVPATALFILAAPFALVGTAHAETVPAPVPASLAPAVTGTYEVSGPGTVTVFEDGTARFDPELTTFYLVSGSDESYRVAECLTDLGWTGDPTDGREAIYAPSYVIASCERAPAGMVPLSADDVSPAVWAQLHTLGYRDNDPAEDDGTIVFVPAGTGGALSRIADGLNR